MTQLRYHLCLNNCIAGYLRQSFATLKLVPSFGLKGGKVFRIIDASWESEQVRLLYFLTFHPRSILIIVLCAIH